jgi:anti-sigma factor RsiW
MDSGVTVKNSACPTGEISAYIDGELSPSEEMSLEMHLAGCADCAADLNAQKQFLMALDMSLVDTGELKLPANFTKTVVASAESSVRGLRRGRELRNATFICSALFLIAVFSVGRDMPLLVSALGVAVEKFTAVAGFAGHFVFDVALGISVVFRSLASQFVFGSGPRFGLFVVVAALGVLAFSRLLARDDRA